MKVRLSYGIIRDKVSVPTLPTILPTAFLRVKTDGHLVFNGQSAPENAGELCRTYLSAESITQRNLAASPTVPIEQAPASSPQQAGTL